MKSIFGLWSWQGVASRSAFVLAGLALLAVKFPLDYFISLAFDRPWGALSYLSPRVSPLLHFADQPSYWMTLMLAALPFLAAALALSARRLRDMGVAPFWAGLCLLPFFHFAFFLVLALAPSKEFEPPLPPAEGPYRTAPALHVDGPPQLLLQAIPRGAGMAFVMGLLASLSVGAMGYLLSAWAQVLGVGLFIGVPFGMGFVGGFVRSAGRDIKVGPTLLAGLAPNLVFILLLLALGKEGVACVVMAIPILVPLNLLGAWAAWATTRRSRARALGGATLNMIALPLLLLFDTHAPPPPEVTSVTSEIAILQSPAEVWSCLGKQSAIDAPAEPIFAIAPMPLGITPYSVPGDDPQVLAFTIGSFVHRVAEVDPPRRLLYVVEEQPHNLDAYVHVLQSDVELIARDGGSTTLRARTTYALSVHPTSYWNWWAGSFVRAAQRRVLSNIKFRAENPDWTERALRSQTMSRQPYWMQSANATCNCTRHQSPGELPPGTL